MLHEIRHPDFAKFVDPDAELEQVSTGYGFLEGPLWHPGEGWLLFSDIQESRQYKLKPDGTIELFRRPSNQANGNCFDLAGQIVTCEHASSHVVRHDHGGKRITVLASHWEGRELNSPNDIICDRLGRIWFTDPTSGRIREDLGLLRDQELDFQGVFRIDPDGRLHVVARDYLHPNGLCLSLDETRLLVNDTWGKHIRVHDLAEDGSLSGGDVWAELTGEGEGVADGMKVTRSGHLLCNGPGGVHLFDQDARCLGVIRTPEKSTNFCFGGPEHDMLYITASTSLYRIKTQLQGIPMIWSHAGS